MKAAHLLMSAVRKLYPEVKRVMVYICLNFDRLLRKHQKALIRLRKDHITNFARKFSNTYTSFDLVHFPGQRKHVT